MTMLERAAIAANCEEASEWEAYTEYAKEAARRCMCDALRAIREPDERVLEATGRAVVPFAGCADSDDLAAQFRECSPRHCQCRQIARAIWQAGIDAAMEEGK